MTVVIGARGIINNVNAFVKQLAQISEKRNLVVQAFDAKAVYGKEHLRSATFHAKRAFKQKSNSTNSLALEIMLYASGERQIQKALQKMGVKKGKQQIAFAATNDATRKKNSCLDETLMKELLRVFSLNSDDSVLKGNRNTLKLFGITDLELSTTPQSRYGDLILEKVALVDVMKK